MLFILTATLVLALASILAGFVAQGGISRKRRSSKGFWKKFWLRQGLLLPVYAFVVLPGLMGWAGSRLVRTRGDESSYAGPILRQGAWVAQDRRTLRAPPPSGDLQQPVEIHNPAGPTLRAYLVASPMDKPRATVVLAHGLFRSAMEIEPVAAMFQELGAEVLLVNLRNHGGSESRPFTYGLDERTDLLAAVEFLRNRPGSAWARSSRLARRPGSPTCAAWSWTRR